MVCNLVMSVLTLVLSGQGPERPSRMQIEIATTDSFKDIHRGAYVDALPESDFTAKLLVKNSTSGQDIFYRIRFEDLEFPTIVGEPMVGLSLS